MPAMFLADLTYALGGESFSVEESAAAGRLASDPALLREAGFDRHHVCGHEATGYSLARRALENIDERLGGIGAVVYATCLPANGSVGDERKFRETRDVKHLMDFPASRLQSDFGLDRAVVIGLNQQACTAMLGSLRLARMLIASEPDVERVLCVTADRFPEGALYEQAYCVISDGAAAGVVSTEPKGFRLVACHSIHNGALGCASDDETVGTYFNYTHRLIRETLAKAALEIDDIRWIVPQNVNRKAWQILSRLLGIDAERVYAGTIAEVGHVISGDNIVNLKRLEDEGRLCPGDHVLLCMAGYGLTWQATILEWVG